MERPASDHSGTQRDRKEVQKSTRHTCEISVYTHVSVHVSPFINLHYSFNVLNLESPVPPLSSAVGLKSPPSPALPTVIMSMRMLLGQGRSPGHPRVQGLIRD